MNFRDSVWDDSEPEYAPGKRTLRGKPVWRPTKKYLDAGFAVKMFRLDGTELEQAQKCRELTREMLRWYEGETKGRTPGTWGWLIGRYKSDDSSAIWDVQPSTREDYKKRLARIENAIGEVKIVQTNYERLILWRRSMEKNGRSRDYIKKWFDHFMIVVKHGILIGDPATHAHCLTLKAIRGEMRIKSAPARTTFMTWPQVETLVQACDDADLGFLGTALLFRFEFALRGTDVYGLWEPAEGRTGGITHNNRMWTGGLTWEMFDRDLTGFEKVINKTRESMPEPYWWSLTAVSHLRERLMAVPIGDRVGPVIIARHGRPPWNGEIPTLFRKMRKESGLPDDLQIRDARAGGGTEIKNMVDAGKLSPMIVRDAMQHQQQGTTDRYLRDRSTSANRVVEMRQKGRK